MLTRPLFQMGVEKINDEFHDFRLYPQRSAMAGSFDDIALGFDILSGQGGAKDFRLAGRNDCVGVAVHQEEGRRFV